jgi:hypothetical protein
MFRVATALRALAVHNRSEAEAFERWADLLEISEKGKMIDEKAK